MDLLSVGLLDLKQRNDKLVEENDKNKLEILLLKTMNSALIELKILNDSIVNKFDDQLRNKFIDRSYRMQTNKWLKQYESAKTMLENCNKVNANSIHTVDNQKNCQSLATIKTEPNIESNSILSQKEISDLAMNKKLEKRIKGINKSDIIFSTIEKMGNKNRFKTEKKYFCDYENCGEKELFTEKELKYHKRKHEELNLIRYRCVEFNCFESFSRPEQLRAHQISKHNFLVNRFVCYCGQRFKNKTNLKRHEKSEHLNIKKKTKEKVNNKKGINFPGIKMRSKNLLLIQKRLDKSLR